MTHLAKRAPEFLPDRSGVYLQGVYTFDELLAISIDNRLSPNAVDALIEKQQAAHTEIT